MLKKLPGSTYSPTTQAKTLRARIEFASMGAATRSAHPGNPRSAFTKKLSPFTREKLRAFRSFLPEIKCDRTSSNHQDLL
jgi:hypothetical protein